MPPEPCDHRFDLTGPERQQMEIGHKKRWAICLNPTRPNHGRVLVCPCNGCNKKCPGYRVEGDEIHVPQESQ